MARISGINIPSEKKLYIGLTYIYGIGIKSAKDICNKTKISQDIRVSELTDFEIGQLREVIESDYIVEGDLRRQVSQNIKNLIDMKSYRGRRHMCGLPVHGQRTRTNARTRKGKSVPIAGKKKAAKK